MSYRTRRNQSHKNETFTTVITIIIVVALVSVMIGFEYWRYSQCLADGIGPFVCRNIVFGF